MLKSRIIQACIKQGREKRWDLEELGDPEKYTQRLKEGLSAEGGKEWRKELKKQQNTAKSKRKNG